MRSTRDHGAYSQATCHGEEKIKLSEQRSQHLAWRPLLLVRYSFTRFFDVTHTPKNDCFFQEPNVELRGAPTMKPEQRAYRDETLNLTMPRQGVSLLNDMLGFFSS